MLTLFFPHQPENRSGLRDYNEANLVCWTTGHASYMDGQDTTALWAYLTRFLGNSHYFHSITAPTHIIGMPPFSLKHNEPTLSVRPQDTPPIWMDKTLWLYAFKLLDFSEILTIFTALLPPHTFSGCLPINQGKTNPTQSLRPHDIPLYGWTRHYGFMGLIKKIFR